MDNIQLQTLLYDINIPAADQALLQRNVIVAQSVSRRAYQQHRGFTFSHGVTSLYYISAKDILVKGETFTAFATEYRDRTNSVAEMVIKEFADKPGFLINLGSVITIGLHEIKSQETLDIISTLYSTLNQQNKALLGATANLTSRLQKNYLYFEDEAEFLKYMLDSLVVDLKGTRSITTVRTELSNGSTGTPSSTTTVLAGLEKAFNNLGWLITRSKTPDVVNKIIFVAELNNLRFSLLHTESYYNMTIGLHSSNHPAYNYIDIDRLFLNPEDQGYELPFHDLPAKISVDEYSDLVEVMVASSRNTAPFQVITSDIIQLKTLHLKKTRVFDKNKQSVDEALHKKIAFKINNLKTKKEAFKLNDVEYTESGLIYADQTIKVISSTERNKSAVTSGLTYGLDTILEMNRVTSSYRKISRSVFNFIPHHELNSPVDMTFDVAYDIFIEEVLKHLFILNIRHGLISEMILKIGDIDVKYTREFSVNKNGVESQSHYINGIKITKDDAPYCIHQAISFSIQDEYDAFLSSVSYTSLKVHEIVKGGLQYDVYDDLFRQNIKMSIVVTREKNKNFLMINNTPKRIRNINKILQTTRMGLFNIVETLLNPDFVEGIEYNDLKGFLELSKKTYAEKEQKTQELLSNTLKTLGIKKLTDKSFYNGVSLSSCYHVVTATKEYFVDTQTPYKIYAGEEGRYICMLDKTPFVAPEVKLVSRLYALKNDSVISKQIATLDF